MPGNCTRHLMKISLKFRLIYKPGLYDPAGGMSSTVSPAVIRPPVITFVKTPSRGIMQSPTA